MNQIELVGPWTQRHEGLLDLIVEVHDKLDEVAAEIHALSRADQLDGDEAEGFTIEDWAFYLAEIEWKAAKMATSLPRDCSEGEADPDQADAEDAPASDETPGPGSGTVGHSGTTTGTGTDGPLLEDSARPAPVGTGARPPSDYKESLRL